jgi:hypothetical protein
MGAVPMPTLVISRSLLPSLLVSNFKSQPPIGLNLGKIVTAESLHQMAILYIVRYDQKRRMYVMILIIIITAATAIKIRIIPPAIWKRNPRSHSTRITMTIPQRTI